jgi:serine/threonine protein kinase
MVSSGVAKIGDFGISHNGLEVAIGKRSPGTLGFMAPEQEAK